MERPESLRIWHSVMKWRERHELFPAAEIIFRSLCPGSKETGAKFVHQPSLNRRPSQSRGTFCGSPEAVGAMLIPYPSMACICSFTLSARNDAPQFREMFTNRVVRWNKADGCCHFTSDSVPGAQKEPVHISDHTFDDWVRQYQRLLFGIAPLVDRIRGRMPRNSRRKLSSRLIDHVPVSERSRR
jgi:hypothetical protein